MKLADLKERTRKIEIYLPVIFLCLKDRRTPLRAKLMAGLTIAYALSPIDLIPDFIPVFGYLDDLILVPAMIGLTISLIPDSLLQEHQKEAEGLWESGSPRKWYYAIPALVVWILILWWIVQALRR